MYRICSAKPGFGGGNIRNTPFDSSSFLQAPPNTWKLEVFWTQNRRYLTKGLKTRKESGNSEGRLRLQLPAASYWMFMATRKLLLNWELSRFRNNMSLTIHVWYIYLHGWLIFMVNLGRYTIHGCYGCDHFSQNHPLLLKRHGGFLDPRSRKKRLFHPTTQRQCHVRVQMVVFFPLNQRR